MKTNEQIAQECAKEFCVYTRQELCTQEKLTALILAAITEAREPLRRENVALRAERDALSESVVEFSKQSTALYIERDQLRAALSVAEGALKQIIAGEPPRLRDDRFMVWSDCAEIASEALARIAATRT